MTKELVWKGSFGSRRVSIKDSDWNAILKRFNPRRFRCGQNNQECPLCAKFIHNCFGCTFRKFTKTTRYETMGCLNFIEKIVGVPTKVMPYLSIDSVTCWSRSEKKSVREIYNFLRQNFHPNLPPGTEFRRLKEK